MDALGNYITALDYADHGPDYQHWWTDSPRRTHLLGKGVLRFHAVYWPAMLLSAGEPLPTDLLVHDYLTADGKKISKSTGTTIDPVALADQFGTDPVRWWLLREVPASATPTSPSKSSSTGPTVTSPMTWATSSTAWSHDPPYRDGRPPTSSTKTDADAAALIAARRQATARITSAPGRFRLPRAATAAVWTIVEEANRYIEHIRPWHLARAERDGDPRATAALDSALDLLVQSCRAVAEHLRPFPPRTAARITAQCTPSAGGCPPHNHSFPRSPYQPSKPGHLRLGRRSGPPIPAPAHLRKRCPSCSLQRESPALAVLTHLDAEAKPQRSAAVTMSVGVQLAFNAELQKASLTCTVGIGGVSAGHAKVANALRQRWYFTPGLTRCRVGVDGRSNRSERRSSLSGQHRPPDLDAP